MNPRSLPLLLLAAASLLLGSAACSPPPLIDRTRPDFLRKSDLTSGTWYVLDTVVGVPATSGLAFEGMQGDLEKVRFQVQEGYLVAYRAYERTPGTDPAVDPDASAPGGVVGDDGEPFRGQPVYAWPILSHFDRQRQYNPATGEQTNVLEENTSDRPWQQREYMRVDWGRNVVRNHFSLTGSGGPADGYSPHVTPLELDEGEDAFTTEYAAQEGGAKQLVYLDFTARQQWEPESVEYPGYGRVPYCLLDPTSDCASTEVRVRTSLRRVDEARAADYEPLRYDDEAMVKFGFFRTERLTYDPTHGVTDSGRILLAQRHNLWQRAHDAAGKVLPVEKREVRPVVYHLSPGFPRELLPAVREVEAAWDHAFRRAVAVPRRQQPGDVAQVFFVCETPVPQGAPAACGPTGTLPRPGDLRYNLLAWVNAPQKAGPLGFGPVGADPETGEIVHGSAFVYGAGLDAWAGDAKQVLDVLDGQTTLAGLVGSGDARDFVRMDLKGGAEGRVGPAHSVHGITAAPATGARLAAEAGLAAPPAAALQAKLREWSQQGGPPLAQGDRRKVAADLLARSPKLEAGLLELPEVRAAVLALAPGDAWRRKLEADPALLRSMARQTLLRMDELQALEQRRLDWASRHNIWLAEFSDDAFYALARSRRQHFAQQLAAYLAQGKPETEARALAQADVQLELRQLALRSVAEHELGHTVGLMHNFQGSYDSLNYPDGYWDLRQESIGVLADGKRVMPVEPEDLAAASLPTRAQVEGGMAELAYSSVMDYGARFNGTLHGLGRYDEAALLFGYAGGGELGWVEVFQSTRAEREDTILELETTREGRPLEVRGAQVQLPFIQATRRTTYAPLYTDRFHYTTLPFHFADKGQAFEPALAQGLQRMRSRGVMRWSDLKGLYSDVRNTLRVLGTSIPVPYIPDRELATGVLLEISPLRAPPVEVPYMYCSDREVGSNVTCNRWDSGADLLEMTRDWVSRYEDYYPFTHFRRDRLFFGPSRVLSRTYGRLLGNLPNVYHHWVFNLFLVQDYYRTVGSPLSPEELDRYLGLGDPLWQATHTMAVMDGVNALTRTLTAAAPGYYGLRAGTAAGADAPWERLEQNAPDSRRLPEAAEGALVGELVGPGLPYAELLYLPRGAGVRSPFTLTETEGYDAFRRVREVGNFWDQYAALSALTNSTTNFLGVDRGSDELRYSLPYYLAFPQQLSRLVSGVWLEQPEVTAPHLERLADGLGAVTAPTQVYAEDALPGFLYPAPRPAPGVPELPSAAGRAVARPTYGARFYTQLFGMAFFSENFDQGFASINQVFALGSGEAPAPASGFTAVSYADRAGGGFSYAALCRAPPPGSTDACAEQVPPPGAAMVLRAQDLATRLDASADPVERAALQAALRESQQSLDLMRSMYAVFGQPL